MTLTLGTDISCLSAGDAVEPIDERSSPRCSELRRFTSEATLVERLIFGRSSFSSVADEAGSSLGLDNGLEVVAVESFASEVLVSGASGFAIAFVAFESPKSRRFFVFDAANAASANAFS